MTRTMRWAGAAVLSAALTAGAAVAVGGPGTLGAGNSAGDADKPATPVKERPTFGGTVDNNRPVEKGHGPFYGIRVNSMDLRAAATRVACFDYECEGIRDAEARQTYQLVRTAWKGSVTPNASCDEIMGLPLPASANVRYVMRMVTTRWVRDVGPNGTTPIGGFVGDLRIHAIPAAAADDDTTIRLPVFAFRLIGTQGLRPGRGDPDDPQAAAERRCDAPLHEEGFYQGGVDRRGLRALAAQVEGDRAAIAALKRLADAQIIGTFEGRLALGASDSTKAYDFCALSDGLWWYDGLLGWRCRPERDKQPKPATQQ